MLPHVKHVPVSGLPQTTAPVVSISHEHGVIEVDRATFARMKIGDVVLIFPMHSCLACNFYASYRTLEGKTIPKMQSTLGQSF